jgi:hypothetical protein
MIIDNNNEQIMEDSEPASQVVERSCYSRTCEEVDGTMMCRMQRSGCAALSDWSHELAPLFEESEHEIAADTPFSSIDMPILDTLETAKGKKASKKAKKKSDKVQITKAKSSKHQLTVPGGMPPAGGAPPAAAKAIKKYMADVKQAEATFVKTAKGDKELTAAKNAFIAAKKAMEKALKSKTLVAAKKKMMKDVMAAKAALAKALGKVQKAQGAASAQGAPAAAQGACVEMQCQIVQGKKSCTKHKCSAAMQPFLKRIMGGGGVPGRIVRILPVGQQAAGPSRKDFENEFGPKTKKTHSSVAPPANLPTATKPKAVAMNSQLARTLTAMKHEEAASKKSTSISPTKAKELKKDAKKAYHSLESTVKGNKDVESKTA